MSSPIVRTNNGVQRHARIRYTINVEVRADLIEERVRTHDISAGGVFIESDAQPSKGSILKMRFRLPESDMLHEIEGRVAWLRGAENGQAPGLGVQFTDVAAAAILARELEDLS